MKHAHNGCAKPPTQNKAILQKLFKVNPRHKCKGLYCGESVRHAGGEVASQEVCPEDKPLITPLFWSASGHTLPTVARTQALDKYLNHVAQVSVSSMPPSLKWRPRGRSLSSSLVTLYGSHSFIHLPVFSLKFWSCQWLLKIITPLPIT